MEHRCSVRLPVAMNVLLYHNNIPVVHCKTSDISPDGMFVQSGPLKYKANTLLKVEFQAQSDAVRKSHMLAAMVVHHANNGLGLMFPGSDAEAMLAWHDMVRRIVTQASKGEDDLSVNTSSTLVFDNKNKETKAEHKEVLLT
jgi:hypothetical protein